MRSPTFKWYYYWTHGAYNKKFRNCCSNAEVHKDIVTFNNNLNRSDRKCHHCKGKKRQCGVDSEVMDKDKSNSSYLPINLPYVVPHIMKNLLWKSYSGASLRYFKNKDKGLLRDIKPAMNQVLDIPNNKVTNSYIKGQIPASSVLSKTTRYVNLFKYIHIASLISLGK